MNRINELFESKSANVCSIFLTAGFPNLNDTVSLVPELEANGADIVEIGMPFSDPLADGETIQESSLVALKNGMTIDILFQQIVAIRTVSQIPIVLMGYFNPVFKYGLEKFLQKCELTGVDGLIIPDISVEEYELKYGDRVEKIKNHSSTFIYYVSSASTTGKTGAFADEQIRNFKKMKESNVSIPILMGFGIYDQATFQTACKYFNGGIIGSAYIRSLSKGISSQDFMGTILKP
jgi:tryptophan synthase alpha chain